MKIRTLLMLSLLLGACGKSETDKKDEKKDDKKDEKKAPVKLTAKDLTDAVKIVGDKQPGRKDPVGQVTAKLGPPHLVHTPFGPQITAHSWAVVDGGTCTSYDLFTGDDISSGASLSREKATDPEGFGECEKTSKGIKPY